MLISRFRGFIALPLLALFAGCLDQERDVATDFGETPLRMLRGVTLDMKAKDLKAVRPNLRFVPLSGYREVVDGIDIAYVFPTGLVGETEIPEALNAPLDAIFVTRSFGSAQEADRYWREIVSQMSATHRPPQQCEKITGSSSGILARWASGTTRMSIAQLTPIATSATVISDRVVFAVATAAGFKPPEGATPMTCPIL